VTSLARPAVDELDVFGQKEYGAQHAHQIHRALGHAVDLDLLGEVDAVAARAEDDLQFERPSVDCGGAKHAAVGDRLVACLPADDLAFLRCMYCLAGGEHEDRFEQIGFALSVSSL